MRVEKQSHMWRSVCLPVYPTDSTETLPHYVFVSFLYSVVVVTILKNHCDASPPDRDFSESMLDCKLGRLFLNSTNL